MTAYSPLQRAKKLLKTRRFSTVITLLSPKIVEYLNPVDSQEAFEYFCVLGTACLYSGDFGGADSYFRNARKIKLQDVNLLLAFAVLRLRKGDTDRAISYYLDALDIQPDNKTAARALEFIKGRVKTFSVSDWVQSNKLKTFYPPLGANPVFFRLFLSALCLAILWITIPRLLPKDWHPLQTLLAGPARAPVSGKRADLANFVLSAKEVQNAAETGAESAVYHYVFTAKEITTAYTQAQKYFQEYRDNAAQREINRLLNSNASPAIRQKARLLMNYFVEPDFDSLGQQDNYPYREVAANPVLYLDCWIIWKGRIANLAAGESGSRCDFLVGYDTLQNIEGTVPLRFTQPVDFDPARGAVNVLAKITLEGGRLTLAGKSLYQPIGQ
jgi:tetratricopeptide (TPR) repeat protein